MKKFAIISGVVLAVFFTALIVLPSVFKEDIKAAIDKSLAETVDADVVWETDDFSLTFFANFPNITASLADIGVVNRAPFEGEVLFLANEIEVEIDLFSLFGDKVRIIGIMLDEPIINIVVDKEGRANYDIAITTANTGSADSAAGYNLGIDHWQIRNGKVTYVDQTLPMKMMIGRLNHSGSGDFTQDEFDLNTNTTADSVMVEYDGTEYLTNKKLTADAVLQISNDFSTYTFKENTIAVNDFVIGIDGFLTLLEESYDMDLVVKAKDTSFKSLLSLVPGIYTEDFRDIRANGTLDFSALIKGIYSEEKIPSFEISLTTKNSMFQYPDLPKAVENITLVASARNSDGIVENTSIDISEFHMDFGNNPVDGRLSVANLRDYSMDGALKASLNLEEITTIFPVEGMDVKGTGRADVQFKGAYDSARNIMPTISGVIALENGYIKSTDLPYALEKVNLQSEISNMTGDMKDFIARIDPFSMQLDGAPFNANGQIANLENYTWDINAQGTLYLKKLASVLQLKDMELAGNLIADVHTAGNMAALEAERYAELPASGDLALRSFSYSTADLPYDIKISDASLTFDPAKMNLVKLIANVGKSDFDVTGYVNNYMGYVLGENSPLKGQLNVSSKLIDLNEFMAEDDTSGSVDSAVTVIEVPENVEFAVTASAEEVIVTNMKMSNARGKLNISDQTVTLDEFTFGMLGGSFRTAGSYSTKNTGKPTYDFALDINDAGIGEAFRTFDIVKNYIPIAGQLTGKVNSEISLSGTLYENMMPDLSTVNAEGVVEVIQAALKQSSLLDKVSSVTNLNFGEGTTFRNLMLAVTIKEGKLQVDPFDVKLGDYQTKIQGATGLDGSMAYELSMLVPAGKMGSKLNSFLVQNGQNAGEDDLVPVTVGIGGTFTNPETMLLMDEQKELIEAALRQKATDEASEKAGELLENVKDEKTRDILGSILGQKTPQDSLKADSAAIQQEDKAKEEAVDKIKDFFKKKKKTADTTKVGK